MKTEAKIITSPHTGARRAVQLPQAVFLIPDDNMPSVQPGQVVTVQYDPADQFAHIVASPAQRIEAAGFKAPSTAFTKDDLRGPEYGHYEAFMSTGFVNVRYVPGPENGKTYTMLFSTLDDFEAWASNNT